MKKTTEKLRGLFIADSSENTELPEPDNRLYRWFRGKRSTSAFFIMAGVYVMIGVFGLLSGNTGSSLFFAAMAPWVAVLGFVVRYEEKQRDKEMKEQNETKEM